MWTFLATEVMLFGPLFVGYVYYRQGLHHAFALGSSETDFTKGAINTGILLLSSITVALAVDACQRGRRARLILWLVTTAVLGMAFEGIKMWEYHIDAVHHRVPGLDFTYPGPEAPHVALFYTLYFCMTGLHAIHLAIAILLVIAMLVGAIAGRYHAEHYTPVALTGLFWHLVDVVWMWLFPLFYLIDRFH